MGDATQTQKIEHLPSMLDDEEQEADWDIKSDEEEEKPAAEVADPREEERFQRWRRRTAVFDATTVRLNLSVLSYKLLHTGTKGYHLFCIEIQRSADMSWQVWRRYSNIREAYLALKKQFKKKKKFASKFPRRQLTGSTKDKTAEKRRPLIEAFLKEMISDAYIASSAPMCELLDPMYRPAVLTLIEENDRAGFGFMRLLPKGNWKRYFFIVSHGCLYYYDTDMDSRPVGVFALYGCDVRRDENAGADQDTEVLAFAIQSPSDFSFKMSFDSMAETDTWLNVIKKTAESATAIDRTRALSVADIMQTPPTSPSAAAPAESYSAPKAQVLAKPSDSKPSDAKPTETKPVAVEASGPSAAVVVGAVVVAGGAAAVAAKANDKPSETKTEPAAQSEKSTPVATQAEVKAEAWPAVTQPQAQQTQATAAAPVQATAAAPAQAATPPAQAAQAQPQQQPAAPVVPVETKTTEQTTTASPVKPVPSSSTSKPISAPPAVVLSSEEKEFADKAPSDWRDLILSGPETSNLVPNPSGAALGTRKCLMKGDGMHPGLVFNKHGRNGKSHPRVVYVDGLGAAGTGAPTVKGLCVRWRESKKKPKESKDGTIELYNVTMVTKGRNTDVLQHSCDASKENVVLSLTCSDRTLDLECLNAIERDSWFAVFQYLVYVCRKQQK